VVIELVENAESLADFQHPENAFYIFGPEDGTVTQKVVNKAHSVVYIPTRGCLNLAATVNVVLYDRLAKSSQREEGNELIRQSRDMNNRIKVKL
jgi:tRNA(Leu) C34 or U34 (ribose-2'-O)-methylase TrmL